jgi:uncharacterized protein involved in response to NO
MRVLPVAELVCREPFRIFFPLGLVLGVIGVSLWPLFYAHFSIAYPVITHARLMIEGFMAAFIFGFLGTAGPRLTSTSTFSKAELIGVISLHLLAAAFHLANRHAAGDFVFLAALLVFVKALVPRFRQRKDSPPPNFVLVALGMLNAILGTALLTWAETGHAPDAVYFLGNAMLGQGFVLLPILGVAPFLLPRMLGIPADEELPESRGFSRQWEHKTCFAAAIGLGVTMSFVLAAFQFHRPASALSAALATIYLFVEMPPAKGVPTFLAHCLRLGLLSIVFGMATMAFLPNQRRCGPARGVSQRLQFNCFYRSNARRLWPQRQ